MNDRPPVIEPEDIKPGKLKNNETTPPHILQPLILAANKAGYNRGKNACL